MPRGRAAERLSTASARRAAPVRGCVRHRFELQDVLCAADLNGDGLLDFFDVLEFLNAFTAGCP